MYNIKGTRHGKFHKKKIKTAHAPKIFIFILCLSHIIENLILVIFFFFQKVGLYS